MVRRVVCVDDGGKETFDAVRFTDLHLRSDAFYRYSYAVRFTGRYLRSDAFFQRYSYRVSWRRRLNEVADWAYWVYNDNYFIVGTLREMKYVLRHAVRHNQTCRCNEHYLDCSAYRTVNFTHTRKPAGLPRWTYHRGGRCRGLYRPYISTTITKISI